MRKREWVEMETTRSGCSNKRGRRRKNCKRNRIGKKRSERGRREKKSEMVKIDKDEEIKKKWGNEEMIK